MADHSQIQWTDATWNTVSGCTRISEGCDHCYIERTPPFRMNHRAFDAPGIGGAIPVLLHEQRLTMPLHWRTPRRVFVDSLGDLFHDDVATEHIAAVFAVMAQAPRHTFQLLTKRPARMRALLGDGGLRMLESAIDEATTIALTNAYWPLPNVWVGVSVESQRWARLRIPQLLETEAAVRFVSAEPLLGPLDLRAVRVGGTVLDVLGGDVATESGEVYTAAPSVIDWVIAGGESGPGARPMSPDWARALRDQCQATGTAFFFKQWGEHFPVPVQDAPEMTGGRAFTHPRGGRYAAALRERGSKGYRPLRPGDRTRHGVMLDHSTFAVALGKHLAGRELDGRTWDQHPYAPSDA